MKQPVLWGKQVRQNELERVPGLQHIIFNALQYSRLNQKHEAENQGNINLSQIHLRSRTLQIHCPFTEADR